MNIYFVIDLETDEIKNNKNLFYEEKRNLLREHIIDFSSFNKLKGDKNILNTAFKQEWYNQINE